MLYAKTKRIASLLCVLLLTLACFGCSAPAGSAGKGQIYLYGETHSVPEINQKEFEIWDYYYHEEGMRHLFVEYPYFMAEYLNQWMQAEDDAILDQIYQDIEGTQGHSQTTLDFLHSIKENCPETVFHGTDVGHCYWSMGQRYLSELEAAGQQDSEQYRLARENIEQGETYYGVGYNKGEHDNVYRENTMAENFRRAYDALPEGTSIMGIYGNAHVGIYDKDYSTGTVPCMAGQLRETYGDDLHTLNLGFADDSHTLDLGFVEDVAAIGTTETVTLNGKEYTAVNLGASKGMQFWQVLDAYEDVKDLPKTVHSFRCTNYPCSVEEGEVFIIDTTLQDGTVERRYYRADGPKLQARTPVTVGFTVEE